MRSRNVEDKKPYLLKIKNIFFATKKMKGKDICYCLICNLCSILGTAFLSILAVYTYIATGEKTNTTTVFAVLLIYVALSALGSMLAVVFTARLVYFSVRELLASIYQEAVEKAKQELKGNVPLEEVSTGEDV